MPNGGCKRDGGDCIEVIKSSNLLRYIEYENLSFFSVGSVHKISAIGYAASYGRKRLVVKTGDRYYQAGEQVESKAALLKKDSILKVEKIRLSTSTHTKYAVCNFYEPGDWTAHVDYTKTPILRRQDGGTCIVDVKTVDVKGTKRKLLLTNEGNVYKLKKSKLEDNVQPGFL